MIEITLGAEVNATNNVEVCGTRSHLQDQNSRTVGHCNSGKIHRAAPIGTVIASNRPYRSCELNASLGNMPPRLVTADVSLRGCRARWRSTSRWTDPVPAWFVYVVTYWQKTCCKEQGSALRVTLRVGLEEYCPTKSLRSPQRDPALWAEMRLPCLEQTRFYPLPR